MYPTRSRHFWQGSGGRPGGARAPEAQELGQLGGAHGPRLSLRRKGGGRGAGAGHYLCPVGPRTTDVPHPGASTLISAPQSKQLGTKEGTRPPRQV